MTNLIKILLGLAVMTGLNPWVGFSQSFNPDALDQREIRETQTTIEQIQTATTEYIRQNGTQPPTNNIDNFLQTLINANLLDASITTGGAGNRNIQDAWGRNITLSGGAGNPILITVANPATLLRNASNAGQLVLINRVDAIDDNEYNQDTHKRLFALNRLLRQRMTRTRSFYCVNDQDISSMGFNLSANLEQDRWNNNLRWDASSQSVFGVGFDRTAGTADDYANENLFHVPIPPYPEYSIIDFGPRIINPVSAYTETAPMTLRANNDYSLTSTIVEDTNGFFGVMGSGGTPVVSASQNLNGSLCGSQDSSITVTFKPTAVGVFTAKLKSENCSINGTSSSLFGECPYNIVLRGTGIENYLKVSPTEYDFGRTTTDNEVLEYDFTIQNDNGVDITTNTSISGGSQFTVSGCANPCTVAANSSITVKVTYSPGTDHAMHTASMLVTNAGSGTQTVSLTGDNRLPVVTVQASSMDFGSILPKTSSTQQLQLESVGGQRTFSVNFQLSSNPANPLTSAPFSISATGLTVVDNGYLNVTYNPQAASDLDEENLIVNCNNCTEVLPSYTYPITVSLSGKTPNIQPIADINFGKMTVLTEATANLVINNPNGGSFDFVIEDINGGSRFDELSFTGGTGQTMSGTSKTIPVTFYPQTTGNVNFQIRIRETTTGNSVISLSVNVTAEVEDIEITLIPEQLTFDLSCSDTTSGSFIVENTGYGQMVVDFPALASSSYSIDSTSSVTLDGTEGSNRTVQRIISYDPAQPAVNYTYTIKGTNPNGQNEKTKNLILSAINNPFALSQNSIDFGDVIKNVSVTREVTLSNSGSCAINWTSVISNSDVSLSPSSGSIPAGNTVTVSLIYTPSLIGSASITVDFNKVSSSLISETLSISANVVEVLPPQFTHVSSTINNVLMQWIHSTSANVAHALYYCEGAGVVGCPPPDSEAACVNIGVTKNLSIDAMNSYTIEVVNAGSTYNLILMAGILDPGTGRPKSGVGGVCDVEQVTIPAN